MPIAEQLKKMGFDEGIQRGIQQGIEQGMKSSARQIARELLLTGKITRLDDHDVEQLVTAMLRESNH
ncbi:hypothetical protein [Pectobacterium cacticida]|uniref:hypothetical protein n=1 Tax=Pectobacterium cacticida TaxID=69221 RepID=UPI002FEEC818